MRDGDRRAGGDRLEKILRHELRHADATVGCRVTGQIAGVHADPADDAHKVRHGGTLEMRAGGLGIIDRDIRLHHGAGAVDKIAILARDMVLVLLRDGKLAHGRVQALAAGGELGDAHELAALVKVGLLLAQGDFDGGLAAEPVAIPVRNSVLRRAGLHGGTGGRGPQVLLAAITGILRLTTHQKEKGDREKQGWRTAK